MSTEPSRPVPAARPAPRNRIRALLAVAAGVLLADIVSKLLVVAYIRPGDDPVRLLGGALYLVQARNSGAAFSLGTGATVVLTAVAAAVAVMIVRYARRLTSLPWAIALGSILGGALGNLVDRLFRAPSPGRGHVVDWISVFSPDGHVWPIFNIADSGIVCGAVLAALLSLRDVEFDANRRRQAGSDKPDADG